MAIGIFQIVDHLGESIVDRITFMGFSSTQTEEYAANFVRDEVAPEHPGARAVLIEYQ